MDSTKLTDLLNQVKSGTVEVEYALNQIKQLEYGELGYAKIDHHRQLRNGYPEVIYCEGKALEHIQGIIKHMLERNNNNILCTRANKEIFNSIFEVTDKAIYYENARIIVVKREEYKTTTKKILVVTGGTADIPVAEEAAITAEVLGNTVERLYDVGVAGIHRLISNTKILQEANVIITVAGMEGALASVVGGLVDKPVIAVPTSIGYGANFGGLSALLCMLNSCASGITVVNIDNGFGAAYSASTINNLPN
ncbi:1-(5-phosphoribosyl)-5-amino-4-imidazole-carboxylate carboxylase [Candidatus Epulonipiscium fishelsonii]|uniref:1-(5-phosphoribosyl)-5-amino-4-imidazole-carboxylate carboxylase n=1 Tax=Candidatus Epulonipiscium fishelsonii TaxID=77094 RepID=A0ACC8XJV9_9FIRM|nr:1-(5-phosphoribosyl)-5-amino-4-imidazole-carboxylate carboxylase [Epulopiscium sp. SCG-D08WGA-EpuloA1]OON94665.1 MAG: 1-(5-phosphoribosyl)-5-amino-4-imidazole-carboxylate carboxylase [Epulopiscium sp. AS2M-Bin002]